MATIRSNPHGGQLSEGRLHGHGHILEAVAAAAGQLLAPGQAKERQYGNPFVRSSPESGSAASCTGLRSKNS